MTDTPTTLSADLPCANCDYNLRGLPTTSNCPECGTPIWTSLPTSLSHEPGPLSLAHSSYLHTLARSCTAMLVAIPLSALTPLLPSPTLTRPAADTLLHLLVAYAILLLTRPEPGLAPGPQPARHHKLLRLTACCAAAVPPLTWATYGHPPLYFILFTLATLLLTYFATAAYFQRLGSLSDRLPPDDQLTWETNTLGPLVVLTLLVTFFLTGRPHTTFPAIALGRPIDDWAYLYATLPTATSWPDRLTPLFPIVLLLWTAAVLLRLRTSFRTLAHRAPTTSSFPTS